MAQDSAVTLAIIAAAGSAVLSVIGSVTTIIVLLVTSKNARQVALQERAWDVEDRATRHTQTITAVTGATEGADKAYHEANTVNLKIKDLHEEIKSVLDVVKHATGEHKPLGGNAP